MATGKMSTGEKKLIKTVLIFILVQTAIVWIIACTVHNSRHIDIKDTKQIEITVDDAWYISGHRSSKFVVSSNSVKYYFDKNNSDINYSHYELHKSISVGDRLTITYTDDMWKLYGKKKWVLEAKSGNKVYRSLDEHNRINKRWLPLGIVFCSIIEIAYLAICVFLLSLQKNNFKTLIRRINGKYRRK